MCDFHAIVKSLKWTKREKKKFFCSSGLYLVSGEEDGSGQRWAAFVVVLLMHRGGNLLSTF